MLFQCRLQALYAGTVQGTVLIARIQADQRGVKCRVVGRMHGKSPPGEAEWQKDEQESGVNSLLLTAVKGYLLTVSPGELAVYNTTHMHSGRHGFANRLTFARAHTNDPDMQLRELPLLAIDRQREDPFLVLCSAGNVCLPRTCLFACAVGTLIDPRHCSQCRSLCFARCSFTRTQAGNLRQHACLCTPSPTCWSFACVDAMECLV